MAIPADDDVVVHLDAEPARDLDDLPGHVDVGARRCRVASGVIVEEPDARRTSLITLAYLSCPMITGVAHWGRQAVPIRDQSPRTRYVADDVSEARSVTHSGALKQPA
jgi:hypothetical protein